MKLSNIYFSHLNIIHVTGPSSDSTDQDFPFDVDSDDHCESPFNAYQDIQPILDKLVDIAGVKKKKKLKIYDPYYCNGSVKEHLDSLGYTNVYNKKEDCYKTWSVSNSQSQEEQQPYPKYDVFITNPPYSSDHIDKLILHLTTDERTKNKPWCLLMPQYVHKKDYYKDKIASRKNSSADVQPFYLVPKKRYVYLPPKDFREKKVSDVHKKSSPFVSMWYIWGGSKHNTDLLVQAYKDWQRESKQYTCELARGKSALRDLRRKRK